MLGCQVLRGGKPCHASTSPKWVITGTARSAKIEHQCPAMRCVLGRVSQLAAAAQETLRLCGAGCHWRKMGHPPSGEGECWGGGNGPLGGHVPRHCCGVRCCPLPWLLKGGFGTRCQENPSSALRERWNLPKFLM